MNNGSKLYYDTSKLVKLVDTQRQSQVIKNVVEGWGVKLR